MFLRCKFIALLVLSGITLSFATGYADSDKYSTSLESLAKQMKRNGVDITPFYTHQKFAVYEDISEYFKKSAESEGIDPYIKAQKKGDTAEAERVLQEQYEKYKDTIGFNKKQKSLSPFIKQYYDQLSSSEKKYNIPMEIIASIIGLESQFGKITGNHFAFNVYVSMYVSGYRKEFAVSQLTELYKFAKKNNLDIFTFNSSYAGAIGPMQFLPWSLNRWFVGDDVFDMGSAITSVANYLAHFKKKRGSLEKAIFAYNPSKLYCKAVLELAGYNK